MFKQYFTTKISSSIFLLLAFCTGLFCTFLMLRYVDAFPETSVGFITLLEGILFSCLLVAVTYAWQITHKISIQQIKDSQERLNAIIDNTVDGLITIDEYGIIQSFNLASEEIFGYQAHEVIGKNINILMPEPYKSGHDSYIQNYHNTGKAKIIGLGQEVQGLKKNGTIFPLELSVAEIVIDGKRLYSGIVRDISKRKNAEKATLKAKNFQDLVMKTIPDIIFVKDKEFKIVQANPSFLSLYPANVRNTVIGSTTLESYNEEEAEEFLKFDKEAFEQGYSETEETIQFPDGNKRTLFTTKTRFEDDNGEPFILGIGRDITHLKDVEEEILRSNEELERFAYIASHDLQEPLRMVTNFTGLLNEEYAHQMDDTAKQYMNFTLDAAKRMHELVSDLLEYSRIGAEVAGFSEFQSEKAIQSVFGNIGDLIKETNADITYQDMPIIYASPIRFHRLLQNLVVNAIKYCPEDRTPKIHIRAEDKGNKWLFSVKDNGIGIKEEYLKQIFIIFKRLHNKNEYSGTGIGLAICQKIVESFGGQLWAESEYGLGSTFYFTIPKRDNL